MNYQDSHKIPFYKPLLLGKEVSSISRFLGGETPNPTRDCIEKLKKIIGTENIFLTGSCSQALDMSIRALGIGVGDEVIIPSFTFTSGANAIVSVGATPVFVDCDRSTLNIRADIIENAITKRTKAVVIMHYAGVSCQTGDIQRLCQDNNLDLIEDAAQCIDSYSNGNHLGTFGTFGTISFHQTKNIHCYSGGAIIYQNEKSRKILHQMLYHGTNRLAFYKKEVEKYTWTGHGSSNYLNDLSCSFLSAQLDQVSTITDERTRIWHTYHSQLAGLESKGYLKRPVFSNTHQHNGHIYFILLDHLSVRNKLIVHLKRNGIDAFFHYQPLHQSKAGKSTGYFVGESIGTMIGGNCLLRLPIYHTMSEIEINYVVASIYSFFKLSKV